MKKTMVLAAALALSLIGNVWLGVQLNTVNSHAVTAMASAAAAEQAANSQGAQLAELTQKLADAETKTQAAQAELDKLTALQKEQAEQKAKAEAEEKAKVEAEQKTKLEAEQKAQQEQEKQKAAPAAKESTPSAPSKPSGGNQGGGIKEPAGGIASTPAGGMVDYGAITDVGEWNSRWGGWEAVDSSGDHGILFPGGGFMTGLEQYE